MAFCPGFNLPSSLSGTLAFTSTLPPPAIRYSASLLFTNSPMIALRSKIKPASGVIRSQ